LYSLYIDTHSAYAQVIMFAGEKVLLKKENDALLSHSKSTMPMIEELLRDINISIHDIKEIIVVNGPGSFTGVRIGVTIAKSLAYTLDIPIKTINSLLIKAISAHINDNKIAIISDSNGRYVGEYTKDNKLLKDFKYYKESEYKQYIKDKKNVIDDIILDYEAIYHYLKTEKASNPHGVNPIYVKELEV